MTNKEEKRFTVEIIPHAPSTNLLGIAVGAEWKRKRKQEARVPRNID
jgi:hypothetical protein